MSKHRYQENYEKCNIQHSSTLCKVIYTKMHFSACVYVKVEPNIKFDEIPRITSKKREPTKFVQHSDRQRGFRKKFRGNILKIKLYNFLTI